MISSFEKNPDISGKPASASAPTIRVKRRERHRLAKARHPVDVLVPGHRADDRAGRHEEERLEEGVGHEVEDPRRVRADRDGHDHVADLAHRRVGDDPLQVGDDQRDRRGDDQRRQAAERRDVGGGRRQLEEGVHAGDQIDARGDHRRGVDQRGDRGRALHRVGKPGVERQLRRLREGADQEEQADRDDRAAVRLEVARRLLEHRQVVEGAELAEDQERREDEADVADDVDHERLHAGRGCGAAPVPVRDQRVRGEADERPADHEQDEVARRGPGAASRRRRS